jgi:DNA topoisomerase IB
VKTTADRLKNRAATCRKYYIHPFLLEAYSDGSLFEYLAGAKAETSPYGLSREEVAVMKLLATHQPAVVREATTDEKLPQALKQSIKALAEIQVVPSRTAVSLA